MNISKKTFFYYMALALISCFVVVSSVNAKNLSAVNKVDTIKRFYPETIPFNVSSLFQDELINYSGAVTFNRNDVSINRLGNLDYTYSLTYNTNYPDIAGWLENLPRIELTYGEQAQGDGGIYMPLNWANGKICSEKITKKPRRSFPVPIAPSSFSSPRKLIIPNQVNEYLYYNDKSDSMSSGLYITSSGWSISCNTQTESGQEGFVATAPNGNKYYLNVPGNIGGVTQHGVNLATPLKLRLGESSLAYTDDTWNEYLGVKHSLAMFVSRIEDKFGNWIEFDYAPKAMEIYESSTDAISNQLSSVTTSDGQKIVVDFVDENKRVSLNNRQWLYYSENGKFIVELPSAKKWVYDLDYAEAQMPDLDGNNPIGCYLQQDLPKKDMTIVSPNGVKARFGFELIRVDSTNQRGGTSICQEAYSLKTKELTYSTGKQYKWKYVHSNTEGHKEKERLTSKHKLAGPLPINVNAYHNKYLMITSPDNSVEKLYLNRDNLSSLFGRVVATENFDSGGNKLRETSIYYQIANYVGSFQNTMGTSKILKNTPVHMTKTIVNDTSTGDVFTTTYDNFDIFGNPSSQHEKFTSKDGVIAHNKHFKYIFENDYNNWVLNLPKIMSVSDDGINYTTVKRTSYAHFSDTSISTTYTKQLLPSKEYHYGQLIKTYKSYHTDGNLEKVEFNAPLISGEGNRTIEYSDYYRGIAQTIIVPARNSNGSLTKTKVVDDNGLVKSETDRNGVTTSYNYDKSDRLIAIDLTNDTYGNWLDTLFSWTGNTRTIKHCTLNISRDACIDSAKFTTIETYDSLLRLIATKTENSVYQNFKYNYNSQNIFTSFVSDSNTETKGTTSTYDALQRLTTQSISGKGTVSYSYLADNKIQITDALNNVTTTTYLAYGSPNYEHVIKVESPESVTTDIAIDVFGNTTSITQSGKNGTADISQTETRLYNAAKQLCMIKRNDVGNTYIERTANGEISWQAQGVSGNTCAEHGATDAQKVEFTYDNLGNQRTISYGDGTPTRTFGLDNNGNIKTITGQGFSQSYNYNNLNLLEDETLSITGRSGNLTLDYGYDSLGNLASLKYPDGMEAINFSPNAFGQATQAIRTYADESTDVFVKGGTKKASYYPSGSIDTFTYGNGIVHKTTLNDRLMPSQITDKLGNSDRVNLSYEYDNNNNITKLTNARNGLYSLSSLTYDGLDRLKTTAGGLGIGSSTITYDGLGNIRTYSNNSPYNPSNLTYNYKANFLLNDVKTTGTNTKIRDFSSENSYDSRGNVKANGNSKGINTFNYNLANQMTTAGGNKYIYDGYNRRVKSVKSNGKTEYSMYSQAGKLLYRETDQGGINYIFLGSKLVAKEGTGVVSSGDSIMNYKPFGESIETPKDDVGYTGHKFDTDLGLSYMQARYYDPVIGRFYSNDPVGFTGEVDTFNRYSYVGNNPYKYTDPDGKRKKGRGADMVHLVATVGEATGLLTPEQANTMRKVADASQGKIKKTGSSGGKRAGKKHTQGAIKEAKSQNAEKNGGVVKCETCGVETTPGTQRTKGSTVNPNEGQGDHIQPKSKGGNGATVKDQSNIDIKCASCNNKKSDN